MNETVGYLHRRRAYLYYKTGARPQQHDNQHEPNTNEKVPIPLACNSPQSLINAAADGSGHYKDDKM